jgi:hypothetical protein
VVDSVAAPDAQVEVTTSNTSAVAICLGRVMFPRVDANAEPLVLRPVKSFDSRQRLVPMLVVPRRSSRTGTDGTASHETTCGPLATATWRTLSAGSLNESRAASCGVWFIAVVATTCLHDRAASEQLASGLTELAQSFREHPVSRHCRCTSR